MRNLLLTIAIVIALLSCSSRHHRSSTSKQIQPVYSPAPGFTDLLVVDINMKSRWPFYIKVDTLTILVTVYKNDNGTYVLRNDTLLGRPVTTTVYVDTDSLVCFKGNF